MVTKLLYNGEEKAIVQNGIVKFTSGVDLNPLIDGAIGSIAETEDEFGNVIFETTIPPIEQKLFYMTTELGFEIVESDL